MNFSQNSKNAEKVTGWLADEVKEFHLETINSLVESLAEKSPIKTGQSIENWQLGRGEATTIDNSALSNTTGNRAASAAKVKASIQASAKEIVKSGVNSKLSNAVPHTSYQNDGTKNDDGTQRIAPTFFAESAVEKVAKS